LSVLLEDRSPAVVGGFTHVFVSRDTRRPVKNMPPAVIQGLAALEKAGTIPLSRL
jgi:acyl-CoA thioesterase FadM